MRNRYREPIVDEAGISLGYLYFWAVEPSEEEGELPTAWLRVRVRVPVLPGASLVALGPSEHAVVEARLPPDGAPLDITTGGGLDLEGAGGAGEIVPVDVRLNVLRWGTTDSWDETWSLRVVTPTPTIEILS